MTFIFGLLLGTLFGFFTMALFSMCNSHKYDDFSNDNLKTIEEIAVCYITQQYTDCDKSRCAELLREVNTELSMRELSAETIRKNKVAKWK